MAFSRNRCCDLLIVTAHAPRRTGHLGTPPQDHLASRAWVAKSGPYLIG